MSANVYSHDGEGIRCVYGNGSWVVCIKNWKPDNDIKSIERLEVHHATDEQFIMISGKAVLLAAAREQDAFRIDVIPMEAGKVYNIPQGTWFNTVARKDARMAYVQDAGTTAENSEYCSMTEEERRLVREKAAEYFGR